jgi:hypothetical protein
MKRSIVLVLLFALLGCAALGAQAVGPVPGAPKESLEAKFLTLELGLPLGYRLSDGALISGRAFGLGVAVADNFSVGIATTQIGAAAPLTAYNVLRLSYTVMPFLGTSVCIGQAGANTAAGLGFYSTLAQSKNASGLGTGLRLRIDYLFDTANLAGGSVVFSTSVIFGI